VSGIPLVLAALSALALAGCNAGASKSSGQAAASADPPSLWSIDTSRDGGRANREFICAGAVIRQGLGRALPEAGGLPCTLIDQANSPSGVFNGRCRLGGEVFGVHSVTSGDVARDFTVNSVMQAGSGSGRRYVSSQRYRQVQSSCPSGWNDGDAGAAGAQRVVSTLTGVVHPVSLPATTS